MPVIDALPIGPPIGSPLDRYDPITCHANDGARCGTQRMLLKW